MKNPCSCFKKLACPTPCKPSCVPSSCNSNENLNIFTCASNSCCEPCKPVHDCYDIFPKPCTPQFNIKSNHYYEPCNTHCDLDCHSCNPYFGRPYPSCNDYPNILTPSYKSCAPSPCDCVQPSNYYCKQAQPCHNPCDTPCNICTALTCSFDCYLNKKVLITFEDSCIRVRILKVCDDTIKAVLLSCGNIVYINCCRISQIQTC